MGSQNHGATLGLSAAQMAYPNERRPWTTRELKTLFTMRGESTDAAAAVGAREKDEAPAQVAQGLRRIPSHE